jgi:hypothetical protein
MVMEIFPENVGASEEEYEKITADQNAVMIFYDYNEPITVTLPAVTLDK